MTARPPSGALASPAMVATPLRSEYAALRGRVEVPVRRTGRGPDRPLRTAGPVLVAGVAGALADNMRPGDIVVASELRTRSSTVASPAAVLLARELRRIGLPTHFGPLLSTDQVVDGKVRAAAAHTGAIAVDTESAFLAAQAPAGQTVALRTIVDTPAAPLLRPGTPWRGYTALRVLRAAAPAIDAWAAATGERELLLAGPRSFCAGVERAIEIVERALDRYSAPVYVRRQIVHNRHVIDDLRGRGAVFVEEVEQIPEGAVAVLAAHGVAPSVRRAAADRSLRVVDATCPLVAKVHAEVRRFAAKGNTVLLIGHDEHEEVVGTRGEAQDNVIVVPDPTAAERVSVPDPGKVAYVMQTTLGVDEAEGIAAVLRERFPAMEQPASDDICYATTNRQRAVRTVAEQSDLVLVIGSQNSSNAHRLAEVAGRTGVAAHLVDDAAEVELSWLAGTRRIGITAAASAPPHLVSELIACLSGLGNTTVREVTVVNEDIEFTLPREVR